MIPPVKDEGFDAWAEARAIADKYAPGELGLVNHLARRFEELNARRSTAPLDRAALELRAARLLAKLREAGLLIERRTAGASLADTNQGVSILADELSAIMGGK